MSQDENQPDKSEDDASAATPKTATPDAEPSPDPSTDEPADGSAAAEEPIEERNDLDAPDDEPEAPADNARDREREKERVLSLFTRSEASVAEVGGARFRFARWTKPIAPAVFGLSEDSAGVMKAGFQEAAALVGLETAETDPELGANILLFVVDEWAELKQVPSLDRLVPDLDRLVTMLAAAGANQYRTFTFGPDQGVKLCVGALRYDQELAQLSAPSLALGMAVQTLLLWSDEAFLNESPVTVRRGGKALVKSRFARLLKAAYDPETPAYSEDAALADALVERMEAARAARRNEAEETADEPAESADGGDAESVSDDGGKVRRGRQRRGRTRAGAGSGAEASVDPLGGDPRPPEEEDAPSEAQEAEPR